MHDKVIFANWKMNGSKDLVDVLYRSVMNVAISHKLVLCLPFTIIDYSSKLFFNVAKIGAQNCSEFDGGAYTGEISCKMLRDSGCSYVIIGHSERRKFFNESNETVARKVELSLSYGLKPLVCIGESETSYKEGNAKKVVIDQINLLDNFFHEIDIAYEPIWAIGTGLIPTTDEIKDMHNFIKSKTGKFPIYGGSVNKNNYKEILSLDEVSGILVGGESLNIDNFSEMLSSFQN